MKESFCLKIKIPSYELDENRLLKISYILKILQEMAGKQLEDDGLSYIKMRDDGIVFLITNIALKINRLPQYNEEINAQTWFCETRGIYFVRRMRFIDEQGNNIIECESLWVIADPQSHKVLRPKYFCYQMPGNNSQKTEIRAEKLTVPENMRYVGKRKIMNSDIDCNGHVSNFIYADIVSDFLPNEYYGKKISEFNLAFLGEALKDQEIEIGSSVLTDGICFLNGNTMEHKCFEASIKFKLQ